MMCDAIWNVVCIYMWTYWNAIRCDLIWCMYMHVSILEGDYYYCDVSMFTVTTRFLQKGVSENFDFVRDVTTLSEL
jgi:hypothetical protein